MRELLQAVIQALDAGENVELVSVLEAHGSTPRGAGAVLAVFSEGKTRGTVGGGNVEYEAAELAKQLLQSGENAVRRFRFVQGDAASLGMVCGGDVTLHFHFLAADDAETAAVLRELLSACGENADVWFARRLDGAAVTAMGLADRCGARQTEGLPPELLQNKTVFAGGWFVLPVVRAGRVYIFGGGHVSQALVPAIAAVGFRPVVYDDRPEFADPALFPQAEAALCGPFEELERHVTVTPDDYVVIMTRGHQADYEVLTQTLRSGAKYIGCIGSRKKLAVCRERLLEAGFTAEEYGKVCAPIGLAIGAETPAEIAVSVTAELIAVRAGLYSCQGSRIHDTIYRNQLKTEGRL